MSDIKWKPYGKLTQEDYYPHKRDGIPPGDSVKWEKGFYINRPYFKYATSKWDTGHIDLYELFFDHLKDKPITLLEFGVYYGESIRYWRDYFTNPEAKIVGFDRKPTEFFGQPHGCPTTLPPMHNVFLPIGEMTVPGDIKKTCEEFGPFDIVVDDGQHDYPEPTLPVFRQVWEYMKDGGLYCFEDIASNLTKHLLDEITVSGEGKGVSIHGGYQGFGPRGGGGGALLILKKTKNRITGLDEELTE